MITEAHTEQESVPPRWIQSVNPLRDGGTYQLAEVGLKSVYMVTSKNVKVCRF
jgi:hypothetical protein